MMTSKTIAFTHERLGVFTASGTYVDRVIARYLPNSRHGLNLVLNRLTGENYDDVNYVSEFVIILASLLQAEEDPNQMTLGGTP